MTRWLLAAALTAATAALAVGCGSGSTSSSSATPTAPSPAPAPAPTPAPSPSAGGGADVTWSFSGQAWQPSGTAPACPSPLVFTPPTDISRVSSILYPGQSRPDYKPHGGFRLDGQTNDIQVVMPQDAVIYRGARYLTGGEIQYTFDFINACGIMHRIGHLRVLTARFQAIADTFPAAAENESRTTLVAPGQRVSAGEVIATTVGLRTGTNVFFDWGVFDLRARNAASASAAWAAQHSAELDAYGICWFDNLPASDAARVRSLPPGDPTAGRTSDYCR